MLSSSAQVAVTARAPAKVNLLLEVGPRRDDGYHDLVTVFQALDLTEDVTATAADGFSVEVEGAGGVDVTGVPLDERNLALRAALLLAERAGVRGGARLTVRKGVPVAGGMAGGSADAAAALVACDALWRTHLGLEALGELAAELGADVPFCLHGRTAVGTGRGDRLVPVLTAAPFHWVLVLAGRGLSTPAVFAECDRLREVSGEPVPEADAGERLRAVEAALRTGDPAALAAALANDLQEAACSLAPELVGTLAAGAEAGALAGLVSGSGPTVALLAASAPDARRLAAALRPALGERVRTATGPVPGARVLEAVRAH
ncbi:4-(cytidine 5'-diphospho)-2-C-methyl-D-erythritol kinase [Kineococcus esterisolvens]|uniref:4-(cytidine 5'-diphospho)-2-C-methyl-D-erythritol kinase n=1 Tax=unclassified Kineococcus TaxID=2621656 RepID=UPI003D7F04CE